MWIMDNNIAEIEERMNQVIENILHENQSQNVELLQKLIKQIYQKNDTHPQMRQLIQTISLDYGYGTIYSIIRQTLQKTCKGYKKLIQCSFIQLVTCQKQLTKVNQPPQKLPLYMQIKIKVNAYHKDFLQQYPDYYPKSKQNQLQPYEQVYYSLVEIIYNCFQNVSRANKQVCQLWDMLKIRIPDRTTQTNNNIRTPQLRLTTLNLLTLKQLIPSLEAMESMDIRYNLPTQFRQMLEKLLKSNSANNKDNIQKLIDVYVLSDIALENAEKEIQKQQQKLNEKQRKEKEKKEKQRKLKEKEKEKQTQAQRESDKEREKILEKMLENQTFRVADKWKQLGKVFLQQKFPQLELELQKLQKMQSERDEQPDWLKKAKMNPIGKILSQRLGGKFCKNEQRNKNFQAQFSQKNANQGGLHKGFGLGLDMPPFRILDISPGLNSKTKIKSTYIEQVQQLENALRIRYRIQQQQQQTKKQETQTQTKKKKKKNKKKKTNLIKTESTNLENQEQQQGQGNAIKQQQKLSKQKNEKQFYEDSKNKQFCEVIKLLKEMKINDSTRQNCVVEKKKLHDWSKQFSYPRHN